MMTKMPLMPRLQKGMAGTLMIVLVGLGLTATALSLMYGLRGGQNAQVALHASTNAQQLAWAGVEATRNYLASLSEDSIKTLTSSSSIDLSSYSTSSNILAAKITSSSTPVATASSSGPSTSTTTSSSSTVTTTTSAAGTTYSIPVEITATIASGTSAQSQSKILVIYQAAFASKTVKTDTTTSGSGGSGGNSTLSAVIDINKDLVLSGNINIIGNNPVTINVNGNVTLSGSVTGVDSANKNTITINATGAVSISSAISVANINSNSSVTLSGGANVSGSINAKGNVTLSGGGTYSVGAINSNGNVTLSGGSATVGSTINAQGNVTISGGNAYAKAINAMGYINWSSTNSTETTLKSNSYVIYNASNQSTSSISANGDVNLVAGAKSIVANGNITMSNNGVISNVDATGNLALTNSSASATTGTIGGVINCKTSANCSNVKSVSSHAATPTPVSVSSVGTVTTSHSSIDAYVLAPSANYTFSIDSSNFLRVSVKNISGVPDGYYYLGGSGVNPYYQDNYYYLCSSVTGSSSAPVCKTIPTASPYSICYGNNNNTCINYDSSSNTWKLTALNMAPGVLWFPGNVSFDSTTSTYYNTILSAGNISIDGGNITIKSPNYAGYANICTNSKFSALYPTNFCNTSQKSLYSLAIGNIALLAGGYNSSGTYIGGTINLVSWNDVYGSVLAGNLFTTGGSTRVHGYIAVAATIGSTTSWGNSTVIDLSNLPSTYDPTTIPCMANCSTTTTTSATTTTPSPPSLVIHSTRYE